MDFSLTRHSPTMNLLIVGEDLKETSFISELEKRGFQGKEKRSNIYYL